MAETRTALDVEDLLANADWLRILAARVLHDESEVDDLVHEAWVAALRRPADDVHDLPSWLAAVVRNLSRRRLRHSSRLEALPQEQEQALEDAAPDPATAYDLEHVRRRVAAAVLDLPEPFRTTVLLTFFEGLPPGEIARRLGVPPATVRTRLRRALLRLRARLGAEGGPDTACAGLVLLALPAPDGTPTPPAPLSAGWLPQAALVLAAGVLCLFTLAVWGGGAAVPGAGGTPGREDRPLAEAHGLAPEQEHDADAPDALAPLAEEDQNTGSVHDDLSRCGGGPLLGAGGELLGEPDGGALPQPSLRTGRGLAESERRTAAPARLEPTDAPFALAAVAGPARGWASAGLGRTVAQPGRPLHASTRVSWARRSSTWYAPAPGKHQDDEDEDDQTGSGDPTSRHAMVTGGPDRSGFAQRAKQKPGAKGPGALPSTEELPVEQLCVCRKEVSGGAERPRPRARRIGPDPTRGRSGEDECPLHPLGPQGPASVPVLVGERRILLLEPGSPERGPAVGLALFELPAPEPGPRAAAAPAR